MPDDRFPAMGYWARATLTVAGALLVLAASWSVRNILVLVLVAAVLAVGVDPQVRWLERRHLSRPWAVASIVLLSVGLLALFSWLVIPPAVQQGPELVRAIPDYLDRLLHGSGFLGMLERKYQIMERMRQTTARIPSLAIGKLPGIAASAGTVIFNVTTVAVLTSYFLSALPRGKQLLKSLMPDPHAERNVRIVDESCERIGGYVSGNILISVLAGILAFIVLAILRVPFAAALALWVAIADLIPNVGATLGAVLCVLVALFSSLGAAIAVAIYFIVYQRIENYFILPRVMTKAIDLSPPTVVVTLMIGASLAGLSGALVALPIAAALKVVIREVWLGARVTVGTSPQVPNVSV